MKDMAFAMAMAKGPMDEDEFLGPLRVAQTVRDAISRRGDFSQADRRIDEFLTGHANRGTPTASGRVVTGMPADHDNLFAGAGPWDNRGIVFSPDGGTGPKTCCLIKFLYPIPTPEKLLTYSSETEFWAGWRFRVLAIYKNGGIKVVDGITYTCDCNCCQFRQKVEGIQEWEPYDRKDPTGAKTPASRSEKITGEDCRPRPDGSKICYGKGEKELKYDPKRDPKANPETKDPQKSWEYSSPTGKVGEDAPPGLKEALDKALEGTGETLETVCVYYMQDEPGMASSFHIRFMKNVCFTGEIWNLCPEKIITSELFRLYMSGVQIEPAMKNKKGVWVGGIAWDNPPDGDRQFIPKCDLPK